MLITNDDLYAQSWNTKFGSNPFADGLSEYSLNTEGTESYQYKYPKKTAHPPGSSKNSGGSPVEQTTEPDENHGSEIPQQIIKDDQSTQKTQKDTNISLDVDIQKTPENPPNTPSQKEPINSRGDKYNLRPNSNPNYSDIYRY